MWTNFSQQDTGPFTLDSITSNLVVDNTWFAPEFVETGIYSLKIFAALSNVPPVAKQMVSLRGISTDRILIFDRSLEAYYLSVNSMDFSGSPANTCSGYLECWIPFYFENT